MYTTNPSLNTISIILPPSVPPTCLMSVSRLTCALQGARTIANLSFSPNTLSSIPLPDSDAILFAAGGQDAEIHLSLHQPSSRRQRRDDSFAQLRCNNPIWQYYKKFLGSINNSVLLTSLSLTRSTESSVEPRLIVSNNDCTVRFYDIAVRCESLPKDLWQSGNLKLEEPINHCGCTVYFLVPCIDLISTSLDIPRQENTPICWGFATHLPSPYLWWSLHHLCPHRHPHRSPSQHATLFVLPFRILFHCILSRWHEICNCFSRRRRCHLGRA